MSINTTWKCLHSLWDCADMFDVIFSVWQLYYFVLKYLSSEDQLISMLGRYKCEAHKSDIKDLSLALCHISQRQTDLASWYEIVALALN